jgi:glycosyltransferase involved in cell wall biosynthesis
MALESRAPRISVIIPVLNDAPRLACCLAALDAANPEEGAEILVVDNGSSDDPSAVVERHPGVRLLREPRRGSYAARNRGVQEARGTILAFTDSDCLPAPDWLKCGADNIQLAEGPVFVGGPVELFARDPGRPTAAELYEAVHAFPQRHYLEALSFSVTANLFVARDVFDRVGSFNDMLQSGGDQEWGVRAHQAGVSPVYASDVLVRHPARHTVGELHRKNRRRSDGDTDLRQLWRQRPRRFATASVLRPPVRSTLRNLRRLDPPTARSKVLYTGAATAVYSMSVWESGRTALRKARPV